jgi:hypothetical protein
MLCVVTDSSLLFFQQLAPFYMVTVCKMLCLDTGLLHLCSAQHCFLYSQYSVEDGGTDCGSPLAGTDIY